MNTALELLVQARKLNEAAKSFEDRGLNVLAAQLRKDAAAKVEDFRVYRALAA